MLLLGATKALNGRQMLLADRSTAFETTVVPKALL